MTTGPRRLSWSDRLLLGESLLLIALAAFVVAFIPFRRVVTLVSAPSKTPVPTDAERKRLIERCRWAVRAWARRVPWRALCFEQGLACHWLLRRRGVATTLYYGAANTPDKGLAAHVWVRAGGADVIGCENAGDFAQLAAFPEPR